MRITFILSAVALLAITLLVGINRPRKEAAKIEAPEPLPPIKVAEVPREVSPEVPPEVYAPSLALTPARQVESPRLSERLRQMDLSLIERSSAKDTPEAKQIDALLAEHGFDRAALPAAYDYAYEYHRLGEMIGDASEGARFHLASVLRNQRMRLEDYGQPSEEFLTNLFAIHPTVFFGHRHVDTPMPIPAE